MTGEAREAAGADLPRLTELATAAVAELAGQRGGARLAADTALTEPGAALADALDSPYGSVWAGTIDGVVVGVAAASATGDVGRVDLVYVEPEARGVGVGEALLGAVTAWMSARGCTVVDAVALPGNRQAKQFFESAGLVARLLVMSRRLP